MSLPQARRFDWSNLGLRIASGFVLVPTALYATLGRHQHWAPALEGRQEALPYLLLISVGVALLANEWGGMSAPGAPVRVSAAVTAAVLAVVFLGYEKHFALAWLAMPVGALAAALIGGLLMGYGARLAYGCNIGAYFSGIASSSLHGWLWLVAAFLGSILGTRLRPWFGLSVEGNLTRAQAGPVARD